MPASSNQVFLNASNCLLTSSFCNLHWLSIAMFLLKFCTNSILSTHAALIKQNKKQCLNLELTRQCNISFLKRPWTKGTKPSTTTLTLTVKSLSDSVCETFIGWAGLLLLLVLFTHCCFQKQLCPCGPIGVEPQIRKKKKKREGKED